MAFVRHNKRHVIYLTIYRKNCTHSIYFCISRYSKMAPRCSQKTIFNMASVRHLECEKFRFLSNTRPRNGNLHRRTKFDRNLVILGWDMWDMEIKLFSKWRPSAILNLRKLQIWSRDLYRQVILHLNSKFRVGRAIWRRDIAKKRFSIWCPSAILNLKNFDFCQIGMFGMKICICVPNLIEIG